MLVTWWIQWKFRHHAKRPEEIIAHAEEEKAMHDHFSEKEIDKTIDDSFPASDPPSWY